MRFYKGFLRVAAVQVSHRFELYHIARHSLLPLIPPPVHETLLASGRVHARPTCSCRYSLGEGIEKKSPADLNKEVEEQKAAMAAKAAEAAAAKEAEPAAAPEAAAEEVPAIKVSPACCCCAEARLQSCQSAVSRLVLISKSTQRYAVSECWLRSVQLRASIAAVP